MFSIAGPSTAAEWSCEACTLLIKELQKHPCLWKVKSPEYKDINARVFVMLQIKEVLHINLEMQ